MMSGKNLLHKICIAIYCNKAYLPGLKVTLGTLHEHNKNLPPVRIISDEIESFRDYEIVRIKSPHPKLGAGRYSKAISIIECFGWSDFDRVIALDCDIICYGDISLLWSKNLDCDFHAARDDGIKPAEFYKESFIKINSGVMVINKRMLNAKIRDDILQCDSYDKGDQGMINEYLWKNDVKFCYLDTKYNCLKRLYVHNPPLWNTAWRDLRILHFVGRKPWEGGERGYAALDALWHRVNKKYGGN